MLDSLFNVFEGWREVRAMQGFSYQVSRSGKRRIVPIEGYRTRGEQDEAWLASGNFSSDALAERFKNYAIDRSPKRKFAAPMRHSAA